MEDSTSDSGELPSESRKLVEDDEVEWEVGEVGHHGKHVLQDEWDGQVTLDAEGSGGKAANVRQKHPQRRATAKDKEFSEMVHKAHLLCLIARGRIVDAACDDTLLQASIMSILPTSSWPSEAELRDKRALGRAVSWFMMSFRILPAGEGSSTKDSNQQEFTKILLSCLQKQAGSAEEVAALSVALLRGLGLATRYVAVLDVASLKPDADSLEASNGWEASDDEGNPFPPQGDLGSNRVASLARILARSASQQVNGRGRVISLLKRNNTLLKETGDQGDAEGDLRSRSGHITALGGNDQDPKEASARKGRVQSSGRGRGRHRSASEANGIPEAACPSEIETSRPKRSGDEEFERDLAMAIMATRVAAEGKGLHESELVESPDSPKTNQPLSPPVKKLKGIKGLGTKGGATLAQKVGFVPKQDKAVASAAVWSRKSGPVLHWAEVYCMAGGSAGNWIHIDAARGIVDGVEKVEGAAAACRHPLRYVVAFAGGGAKDVTRRYVTLWSTVRSLRVDEGWWEAMLYPLKQLEAVATAGHVSTITSGQSSPVKAESALEMKDTNGSLAGPGSAIAREGISKTGNECSTSASAPSEFESNDKLNGTKNIPKRQFLPEIPVQHGVDRSAIEDMEMETKTFTEPLPTNQQAYRSHHLYVIERWLTKYQTLHPRGPVLGYCAGHAVYPRTCVQELHTYNRWLREGFRVKSGETPAKVVKASRVTGKEIESAAPDVDEEETSSNDGTTSLYGKWQTEAWQPPRAVNGIVPKNERGQVDVWSEKCIPGGTVHLRLPRLVPIVKRLEIDFAPAMVGFEMRKGKSMPVYEGIIVCEENKDLILDVYEQQEEVRLGALLKKREEQASKRWWTLLHSMSTRWRLQKAYGETSTDGKENVSNGSEAVKLTTKEIINRGNSLATWGKRQREG